MKYGFLMKCCCLMLLVFFTSIRLSAQQRAATSAPSLSTANKNAIISLFAEVHPSWFRLEFNNGRETYGSRKLSSAEVSKIEVRKRSNVSKGTVILYWDRDINAATIYLKDGSIISVIIQCFNHPFNNPFLEKLGKFKTSKLKSVMTNYIEDPDILDNPNMISNVNCIAFVSPHENRVIK